ncbi:MAG: hypothetical protein GX220_02815 [Treponema sp.]|nr:hypothetical protein [Treponema sp.]
MKTNVKKSWAVFVLFAVLAFGSIMSANLFQTNFGSVEVNPVEIQVKNTGIITGKLYRPKTATSENPSAAVLLMHGYQNDRETSGAFAIELARRGIVALSIDEYGHGYTTIPMKERGATNIKFPRLGKKTGGPYRYKIMMNFSNLDFFYKEYSDGLKDTSMGGRVAYKVLSDMDFVDSNRIGITGHSMGTWSSWSVAASFPNHKAIVLQCGELYEEKYYDAENIKFNNILLLQAKYDEFNYFRDYKNVVSGLENTELRYKIFAKQDGPIQWNTTYGSFKDGSARRMELLNTNHRLTTHYPQAFTVTMDWFVNALNVKTSIKETSHIYLLKEILVLLAMFFALATMLPLLTILINTKFFNECAREVSQNEVTRLKGKKWWKVAIISILISGITFPFLTQLGHGLFPFPENIFRMTVGNGIIMWLSFLMIVNLCMILYWYKKGQGKKLAVNLYDLGLATKNVPAGTKNTVKTSVIAKSVLLAFILCSVVYIMVLICDQLFMLDFRFIWPFFKPYYNAPRFAQFWIYLPFYFAFFFVSGGVKLFGQLRLKEEDSPAKTQLKWWLLACVLMLGGMFMSVLIEYIPFFAGLGPGADLLFGSTFGGPFMSYLILGIPQFALIFFLSVYAFRKTGYVYVGSTIMAIIASWMVTSGSAML